MATHNQQVQSALDWLKQKSTAKDMANLKRFGIAADKAFGVSVANIQALAKQLGRNHELAAALWETGFYEARMLTSFVDEPEKVTPEQMERWCRDFDNWGICDTVCFHLFDRTPHAWPKVQQWCGEPDEFVKRAGFALMASLAGHDKTAGDDQFLEGLALIERESSDPRNFVKKAVLWALRRIATRSVMLKTAAAKTARKLAESPDPTSRWIGKTALREMTRSAKMEKQ
jgi:3-methyladenine DNA glycosylase AlkD